MIRYPILIEEAGAAVAFGVVVPDLPGCFSAGDTLDEAMDAAREAVTAWVDTALDGAGRVSDGPVLALLDGWMAAEVMAGLERWTPTSGTPQGAVISPLLANIYLHPLDQMMAAHGYRMVRYADDFVVLRASREAAEAALALISTWVAENGLHLHPGKASTSSDTASRKVGAGSARRASPA